MGGGGRRIFLFFLCITCFFAVNAGENTRREAFGIIIGGDPSPPPPPEIQECPPPPPPPCPPPPPPPPTKSPPPPPPPPKPKSPPPPPPKPKSPPPPPPNDGFESSRLQLVYPVLQAFRKKVMNYDPFGVTKNWIGKNICAYNGLSCDIVPVYQEKAVAGVNFNNKNIGGPGKPIDDLLIGLEDIVYFHANSNNFTGSIPSDIGKLKYFYELDLSNNKFTGEFPYQVLRAKKLLFLDLRFNTFAGVVPPEVFLLKLDLLFINNNNFVQKLPDNLGSTTALYLTLANNKFVDGIPRSIGNAADTLIEVLFLNNQLTGCLPYEIGLLKKSTVFDVGMNHLTGPIPHSFQCLKSMELLNLAQNHFYGAVPEAVCALPKLSNFTLSYNYFTQVGPQCRKLIKNGILNVKMNCILDLPNQRSAADCAGFFSKHHSCSDEKSLTYVPCSIKNSDEQLESSVVRWDAPTPAPAQAPGPRSYGALSPH